MWVGCGATRVSRTRQLVGLARPVLGITADRMKTRGTVPHVPLGGLSKARRRHLRDPGGPRGGAVLGSGSKMSSASGTERRQERGQRSARRLGATTEQGARGPLARHRGAVWEVRPEVDVES